jgi:helicase
MDVSHKVKTLSGFPDFNPMQKKALEAGLFDHNMVVSAPTASGKTVVAELVALNTIINQGQKVVYTCPLKALAAEHHREFKKKYGSELKVKATLSTGDFDSSSSYLSKFDLIYTTYEKLDSLIRHRAPWLNEIGALVIDEIHEIDSDRGPTLEILITKMKAINPKIKVVGLSATIPNADHLAQWLDGKLVESDYRPVPLKEGVYFSGEIAYSSGKEELDREKNELEAIAGDTLKKGKQLLIFAQTRKSAEQLANKLAPFIHSKLDAREKTFLQKHGQEILGAMESPTEQCRKLSSLVENGVSFHHAGLVTKQRELIEDFFRQGKVKLIASTPTLAMGVNLPSHTVLIHSIFRYTKHGPEAIPVREYKQWVGRAGRPKYDVEGRSILIARNEMETDELRERYIQGQIEEVGSKLSYEPILRMHLLSLIASRFIFDLNTLEQFFSRTFYALQYGDMQSMFAKLNELVEELHDMDFVQYTEKGFEATRLGARVSELYLDPLSAHNIINSLKENKRGGEEAYFMLLADCTELFPYPNVPSAQEAVLWGEMMEEKDLFFFEPERKMYEDNHLINKYLLTKIFKAWVNEVSEQELMDNYKLQPGILRSKLERADWLLYACIELEKCMDLKDHFLPLTHLRNRVKYGIRAELLPLVQLRNIGRVRARNLFRRGIKGIGALKQASLQELSNILGPRVALNVKEQLGQVDKVTKADEKKLEQKTDGQKKLESFT